MECATIAPNIFLYYDFDVSLSRNFGGGELALVPLPFTKEVLHIQLHACTHAQIYIFYTTKMHK